MVKYTKIRLQELYEEYKAEGSVKYHADLDEINKYSHREMAGRFAEVLDQLV